MWTPDQIDERIDQAWEELEIMADEQLSLADAATFRRRAYEVAYASQVLLTREEKGWTESTRKAAVTQATIDLWADAELAQNLVDSKRTAVRLALARVDLLRSVIANQRGIQGSL